MEKGIRGRVEVRKKGWVKVLFFSFILAMFAFLADINAAYSATPGTLKWSFKTKDSVYSSAAIGPDGTVYLILRYANSSGFLNDYLCAINPDNGSIEWQFGLYGNTLSSPTVGRDGTIYVGSTGGYNHGYIYALTPEYSPDEGHRKWVKKIGLPDQQSTPAIGRNGVIYVGTALDNSSGSYGELYAIRPGDGSTEWTFDAGGAIYSSPAVAKDGTVYVISKSGYLYAIYDNGTEKWNFPINTTTSFSSPAVGLDGTVYANSNDGYLYAIYDNGTQKWKLSTGGSMYSSPVIGADGTIYTGLDNGSLCAIKDNGTKGEIKWCVSLGTAMIVSTPAVGSDGTIYIGSTDDSYAHIYAINPDGSVKWNFQIGGAPIIFPSPAVSSDGTVYVGCDNFYVYALNSSSMGLADSPWPKFSHDNQNTGAEPYIVHDPTNDDTLVPLSSSYGVMDNATIKTPRQAENDGDITTDNEPKGISSLSKVVEMQVSRMDRADNSTITVSDLSLPTRPLFYKYVNGQWINLDNNTACGNCNFSLIKQSNGMYTISFTIKDNGKLDSDGTLGKIKDPVVIAQASSPEPSPSSSSSSGGGCTTSHSFSMGLLLVLLVGVGFLIGNRLRRKSR